MGNITVDSVDIHVYLACAKALVEKYGNFKMSADLHNEIIYHLCKICAAVELQIRMNEQ